MNAKLKRRITLAYYRSKYLRSIGRFAEAEACACEALDLYTKGTVS